MHVILFSDLPRFILRIRMPMFYHQCGGPKTTICRVSVACFFSRNHRLRFPPTRSPRTSLSISAFSAQQSAPLAVDQSKMSIFVSINKHMEYTCTANPIVLLHIVCVCSDTIYQNATKLLLLLLFIFQIVTKQYSHQMHTICGTSTCAIEL